MIKHNKGIMAREIKELTKDEIHIIAIYALSSIILDMVITPFNERGFFR